MEQMENTVEKENSVENFETKYTTKEGEIVTSDATVVHLEDQQQTNEHQENNELMATLTERYDKLHKEMLDLQEKDDDSYREDIATIQKELNQIEEDRARLESVTKKAA